MSRERRKIKGWLLITAGSFLDYTDRKYRGARDVLPSR
jgi:hypothetical protein